MRELYCRGRGASSGVRGCMPGHMQEQMQGAAALAAQLACFMDDLWKACLPTGTALNMFYLLEDGKIIRRLTAWSILHC